jgi:hypothetical protein
MDTSGAPEVLGMFVSTFEVPSTTFKVSTFEVLTFHHVTNLLMLQDRYATKSIKQSSVGGINVSGQDLT